MLIVYIPVNTPRSDYIFELILKNELGIEYTLTTNKNAFERYGREKINYSPTRNNNEFFIKSSTLLFEKTIEKLDIPVEKKNDTSILFPTGDSCDMGFDVFAAIFYMVSRYEEYLPFNPDKHGRFKATDSLAYQHNFLQFPVVNTWIQQFKNKLAERFPSLKFATSSFKAIVTYDIDIAYAFKGRGVFRMAGSTIKDILRLKIKNLSNRLQSALEKKDPWDVYDHLKDVIVKNKLTSIFFFLLGDYSKYDKNINYHNPLMTDLVKKVSGFSELGIHPSYRSSKVPQSILIEKSRLEKISGKRITKSRQHYLRFTLPDTYNQLLSAGIKEDYSMGFADMPGFRAGICTPFYFYDIKKERATDLKIFPMTCMEGSFLYYLVLKPSPSQEIIFSLIDEVKKVNGIFISTWHNNTVSEDGNYKEWKQVHDNMIDKISKMS